jgi:hypothetical protein
MHQTNQFDQAVPYWHGLTVSSPPEETMADDKSKAGQADRSRINVNEDYELSDWSQKVGCSPEQLKEAVRAVGPMAEDVRRHLGRA